MNWLNHTENERLIMLQNASSLPDCAVEKDWWVTMTLKALFNTSCADKLEFKGGTSLSKCWNLIDRFSEDIDIALHHTFFTDSIANNNQLKNLRKRARKYILGQLLTELDSELSKLGVRGYSVQPLEVDEDGLPISSDADPTVLLVCYDSVARKKSNYVPPRVKVEVSCLSMDEPVEDMEISSIISKHYPEEDSETSCIIRTVLPSRTFLEKVFLLNEEFQRESPRSTRMSRHLYDLVKLMDNNLTARAFDDMVFYRKVVEHRRRFYHVSYANYDRDYPDLLNIVPPENCISSWRDDYAELQSSFIHGDSPSFEELLVQIKNLENRFHQICYE